MAGLRGESSRIYRDEHGESDDEEEETVRRGEAVLVAGIVAAHSLETFWERSLRVAEEPITFERERRDVASVVGLFNSIIIFIFLLNYMHFINPKRGKVLQFVV